MNNKYMEVTKGPNPPKITPNPPTKNKNSYEQKHLWTKKTTPKQTPPK